MNNDQEDRCIACGSVLEWRSPSPRPPAPKAVSPSRLEAKPFKAGLVLNQAIAILSSRFAEVTVIILVFSLPIAAVSAWLELYLSIPFSLGEELQRLILAGLAVLVLGVLSSIAGAAQTRVALNHLRGRPVTVADALGTAAHVVGPVLGASILSVLAISFGLLAFIIPGLVLLSMLALTTAVVVEEKASPLKAMERSSSLTRGFRWSVFYAVFLLSILNTILSFAMERFGGSLGLFRVPVAVAMDLLLLGFQTTAMAVLYHRLRAFKEGEEIDDVAAVVDDIASVFD
jgi:hypothetical protein